MIVLYATETGNAEMLAEDIASHLGTTAKALASASSADLHEDAHYVFITSTYGEGELPSSARTFFEDIEAQKPDLSQLRFSVFALGDEATYPDTYANAGTVISSVLTGRGAHQVGPIGRHNAAAAEVAEEVAFPWIDDIRANAG